MNELLTSQDWVNYYSCNCGGTPKEYWNNKAFPGYEVRTRPRRGTFTIWNKNIQIYGPEWAYQLEATLKKFEIYA